MKQQHLAGTSNDPKWPGEQKPLPAADAPAVHALQRVEARGALSLALRDGRTRPQRLFQEGAAKIRLPRVSGEPAEAVLINTAGGLTGGDRLAWAVELGAGSAAVVTTQAFEKIYRAGAGHAEVSAALSVEAGARLAWLPQETIVFEGGALSRRLEASLARDAEALIVEATVFGRTARGERVQRGRFADRWRIYRQGQLVHAEDFAIGPDIDATLRRAAAANGAVAMATVLAIGDAPETKVAAARHIVGEAGGVSAWTVGQSGKLLARLVAADGYALRQRLVPLIELLNGQAGLPKVWSL